MNRIVIAKREIKVGFRNPWAYTFLALFTLFSLALMLIQSQNSMSGYTHTTGTMLNLILYLLPLMTLLLGAFSVTAEREEGSWHLLSTYSLSAAEFMQGKYTGLLVVLAAIVAFGYGLSSCLGVVFGNAFSLSALVFFLAFSLLLIALFLGIAILVGALCSNRWQALTVGVSIWFVAILGWPTLLVSTLGWLPYAWIKPALVVLTFCNPAELIRLFMVVQMGGGSILGPEYYQWVEWIKQPLGPVVFFAVLAVWLILALSAATLIWERKRGV